MTEEVEDLRLQFEWEPNETIRTPELATTWARLEIWVGADCVTSVEHVGSGSARRSVHGALYPLAEWVAYNWWFLRGQVRPAALSPRYWTYLALQGPRRHAHSWLRHHNLRGVGDGQAWPDLTILPTGPLTRVVYHREAVPAVHQPVRFLSEGEALVDSRALQLTFSNLVEAVLDRLEEEGVTDTPLAKEWEAVTSADEEEASFCHAAARLGLDPYSIDGEVAELIMTSAEQLEGALLDDFLHAVAPYSIRRGLEWIEAADREIVAYGSHPSEEWTQLSRAVGGESIPPSRFPWKLGWSQAQQVRRTLGVSDTTRLDLGALVPVLEGESRDAGLQALGGIAESGTGVTVLGRGMVPPARRFTQARSLWHLLYRTSGGRFLLTPSATFHQQVARSFAAELLAPAAGVSTSLAAEGVVTQEDLEMLAERYGVSSFVIQHQIENQLDFELLTPT